MKFYLQININTVDKNLFTELVYGTIKRKYTLDYLLKPFIKTKIKSWVRQLLWMSLYQYLYLDKIPNHAIIHEAVDIAKKRGAFTQEYSQWYITNSNAH